MLNRSIAVWGILLALLIVAPGPVDAQAQIALSVGTTFATLEGEDAERPFGEAFGEEVDLRDETGFFAGASLSLPLRGILSISPGLYFVQKGASFNREGKAGSLELSYLEVPVTIGVALTGTDRPFGVSLFAGPEIAFEIDCDLEDSGFDILLPYGQLDDCHPPSGIDESERKKIDFGLVFGADVSYGAFFVKGGLDIGLTSLDDSDADEDFKNSAWFLGAGILIGG